MRAMLRKPRGPLRTGADPPTLRLPSETTTACAGKSSQVDFANSFPTSAEKLVRWAVTGCAQCAHLCRLHPAHRSVDSSHTCSLQT